MPTVTYPELTITWPKPSTRVIYVAGPFRAKTQWGIMQNVRRAEAAALGLWKRGYAVICPHAMTQNYQNECPDETWLTGAIELLKRCDAIYMLDGWRDSEGSVEELRIAKEIGLRVMFERYDNEEDCLSDN